MVSHLIDKCGANVNALSEGNQTALMAAAELISSLLITKNSPTMLPGRDFH